MSAGDNLPAVPQPASVVQGPVVQAPADTDSWTAVAREVFTLAERINGTEFVPKALRNSPAATAAAMFFGREVGLPPMTSLTQVHVIEGRPALSAEAQRALVLAAGHDLHVEVADGGRCVLRGRRRGSEQWTTVEWNIDMAKAAGLAGKAVWKAYPRAMLLARATTELCRMIFPDVIRGFRGLEEARDMADAGTAPDTAPEPASTGGTVQRKRRTGRKQPAAVPAAERPTTDRPRVDGPPLPGEENGENSGAENVDRGPADASSRPSQHPAPPLPGEPAASPTPDTATAVDPPGPGPAEDAGPPPVTQPQLRLVHRRFGELGLKGEQDRDRRLWIVSAILRRDVTTTAGLTRPEAQTILDTLHRVKDLAQLEDLIAQTTPADTDNTEPASEPAPDLAPNGDPS